MIDLDITAVIQFINFLITLVLLNFLLITPIRKIIEKRKEAMASLQGVAYKNNETADGKLENYNKTLAEVREKAAAQREALRNEALQHERELTEGTMADAQARIQKTRAEISSEVDLVMAELKAGVPALAKQAASKIMA